MTPDEINRAIAESVGWTCEAENPTEATMCWVRPGNMPHQMEQIPNYHGDLNACAEFEDALLCAYDEFRNDTLYHRRYNEYQYSLMSRFGASAPAPARCEAYLRTIGKWRSE